MPDPIETPHDPFGAPPSVPEPRRREPDGDVEDLSPELEAEMKRVMEEDPAPERQQLEDWPVPKPADVDVPSGYGPENGDLEGDELAKDERTH